MATLGSSIAKTKRGMTFSADPRRNRFCCTRYRRQLGLFCKVDDKVEAQATAGHEGTDDAPGHAVEVIRVYRAKLIQPATNLGRAVIHLSRRLASTLHNPGEDTLHQIVVHSVPAGEDRVDIAVGIEG
ncbi:hypothetical protein AC579_8327 [Pseudocercospora musae]|uniref:Uncharacterized protein n=1 Tax=Pseudocercospora musae TaxID=113226 RepID=A0A139I764_9PEZI|nr:hypothetical protein AC579_8327 [Pseudocercospora musae]